MPSSAPAATTSAAARRRRRRAEVVVPSQAGSSSTSSGRASDTAIQPSAQRHERGGPAAAAPALARQPGDRRPLAEQGERVDVDARRPSDSSRRRSLASARRNGSSDRGGRRGPDRRPCPVEGHRAATPPNGRRRRRRAARRTAVVELHARPIVRRAELTVAAHAVVAAVLLGDRPAVHPGELVELFSVVRRRPGGALEGAPLVRRRRRGRRPAGRLVAGLGAGGRRRLVDGDRADVDPSPYDVVLAADDPMLDAVLADRRRAARSPPPPWPCSCARASGGRWRTGWPPSRPCTRRCSRVPSSRPGGARRRRVRLPPDEEPPVLTEREGDELRIVLNRPRRHNAVTTALRDGLAEALTLAAVDDSITAVRLSGNGPSFCSGGDLGEFGSFPDPATAHVTRLTRSPARLAHLLADRLHVQLHGACMGAGHRGAGVRPPRRRRRRHAHRPPRARHRPRARGRRDGRASPVAIGRHRTAALALSGATHRRRDRPGVGPRRRGPLTRVAG